MTAEKALLYSKDGGSRGHWAEPTLYRAGQATLASRSRQ
jgi:hypothetical protein